MYPCLLGVKSIYLKVFISSRYSPSVFFCVFIKLIIAASVKVIGTPVAATARTERSEEETGDQAGWTMAVGTGGSS